MFSTTVPLTSQASALHEYSPSMGTYKEFAPTTNVSHILVVFSRACDRLNFVEPLIPPPSNVPVVVRTAGKEILLCCGNDGVNDRTRAQLLRKKLENTFCLLSRASFRSPPVTPKTKTSAPKNDVGYFFVKRSTISASFVPVPKSSRILPFVKIISPRIQLPSA